MWRWFKKPATPSGELAAFSEKWLEPQSLAVAMAEAVFAYVKDVKAGRIASPAYRRHDGAIDIWRDVRLEALHRLFGIETADPFLLADRRRQSELLTAILDKEAFAGNPPPRGEAIFDTVLAVRRVYGYLSEAGRDSGNLEIGEKPGRTILDHLSAEAVLLRESWEAFERAVCAGSRPRPEMPRTLIELLCEDVTAKAKSVALSAAFGPDYALCGDAEARALAARILAARDPDELA